MNNSSVDEWEKSSFLPSGVSAMGRQLRENSITECVVVSSNSLYF